MMSMKRGHVASEWTNHLSDARLGNYTSLTPMLFPGPTSQFEDQLPATKRTHSELHW